MKKKILQNRICAKSIVAAVLALLMLFLMFPEMAFAASGDLDSEKHYIYVEYEGVTEQELIDGGWLILSENGYFNDNASNILTQKTEIAVPKPSRPGQMVYATTYALVFNNYFGKNYYSPAVSLPITKLVVNGKEYTLPANEDAWNGELVTSELRSSVDGVTGEYGLEVTALEKNLLICFQELAAEKDVVIHLTFEKKDGSKPGIESIENDPQKDGMTLYSPVVLGREAYRGVMNRGLSIGDKANFNFHVNQDTAKVIETDIDGNVLSEIPVSEDGAVCVPFDSASFEGVESGTNMRQTKYLRLEGADGR